MSNEIVNKFKVGRRLRSEDSVQSKKETKNDSLKLIPNQFIFTGSRFKMIDLTLRIN